MTVFKLVLTLLRREWKSIIIYLIIFFIFSVKNTNTSTDLTFAPQNYTVAYVQEQEDSTGQGLYEYMSKHHEVEKVSLSPTEAREYALLGRYDAIIYRSKEETKVLTSPTYSAGYTVANEVDRYLRYEKILGRGEKLNDFLDEEIPLHLEAREKGDEYKINWVINYFKFSGYIFLAVGILIVGQSMIDMSKKEVFLRTQISPLSSFKLYTELLLALFAALLFFIVFLGVGGSLILKSSILTKETLVLLPGVVLIGISSIAMATLIALAFRSKIVVSGVSTTLSLVLSFISGIFVPTTFLPQGILNFGKLFPLYYYVQYLEKQRLADLAMIALFILVYTLLGIYVTRERRKA